MLESQIGIVNNTINRRAFLGGLLATTALPFIEGCQQTEQYTDQSLQKLGHEISDWRLSNGKLMVDLSEEAKLAGKVLRGEIDPRAYLPYVKIPLPFVLSNSELPALTMASSKEVAEEQRKVEIISPSGKIDRYNWFTGCSAALRLPTEVYSSTGRLPISIKEISQLFDFQEYSRLYLSKVRESGVTVRIYNPDNIITSPEEENMVLTFRMRQYEEISLHQRSFFLDLVDIGSFIRVGGFMYANWYLDQLETRKPVPQTQWTKTGSEFGGYLQAKGLIKESGGMFIWTQGQPPKISSSEFLSHVIELTGIQFPQFR